MAAIPAYVRTWTQKLTTGTPGARITYSSLADTLQNYLYGVKEFLVAGGCTVVFSASAGTGPTNSSDTTDRWSSASDVTPRATSAAASQAWIVLADGNSGQLLLAWQGSSDSIGRISYSPGALFTLAGTTNNQPTATDEIIISTGVTLVGTATSADRVWHGLISSDAKAYRFTVLRSSTAIGQTWSVESFTPYTPGANVTISSVACWCYNPTAIDSTTSFLGSPVAYAQGAQVKVTISGVDYTTLSSWNSWLVNSQVPLANSSAYSQPEIQGANGYIPWPCMLFSSTTGARGYLGMGIDMWCANPENAASSLYGQGFGPNYEWWQVGVWLWPNPSNTAPTIA